MAETEDETAAAAQRLEAALERIATLAARERRGEGGTAEAATAELAARLDALIAEIRAALARAGG